MFEELSNNDLCRMIRKNQKRLAVLSDRIEMLKTMLEEPKTIKYKTSEGQNMPKPYKDMNLVLIQQKDEYLNLSIECDKLEEELKKRVVEALDKDDCRILCYRMLDNLSIRKIAKKMNYSHMAISKRLDKIREIMQIDKEFTQVYTYK